MNTQTLLKARFDIVRKDLERVMASVTDELLDWAPAEGMRTVRGQFFEIAGKEVELLSYAKAFGEAEWVEVESFGPREKTIEGWKEIMRELRADTLAYLDAISESDLSKLVRFPEDWWEGLGQAELPLHEVLRNIAAHEWYHTGQLVSYLWFKADD